MNTPGFADFVQTGKEVMNVARRPPYNQGIPMSYKRAIAILLLLIGCQIGAPAQSPKSHEAPKTTPKTTAKAKPAQHKPDLAEKINAILSQPQFAKAHWGIDAVDLATGKAI